MEAPHRDGGYRATRETLLLFHGATVAFLLLGAPMAHAQGTTGSRAGNYGVVFAGDARPPVRAAASLGEPAGGVVVAAASTDVWTSANSGLVDNNITALAVDPVDPDTLYAGTASHGVFKSTNAGAYWAQTGLGDVQVNVLAIDSSHPGTLYAGTYDKGLLKSLDGGASWSTAGPDIQVVSSLAVNPHDSNSLLLAGNNRADWSTTLLFRSTDAGRSWTHIKSIRWAFSVAIAPANLNILYALCSSGDPQDDRSQPHLLRSTDGGNTWTVLNPPDIGVYQLVVDPVEPSRLFAYGDRFFRSTDGGETWTPHTLPIDSIVADPLNSGMLYSIAGGKVYRSTDNGGSWSFTEGLTDAVQALAVSGSDPPVVFAGTQTMGVYKSTAMLTLDQTEYCVGTTWTASVVNAVADTAIRLVGVSNGVQWSWPDWGTTGSDGKYSTAGTFAAGSEGNHQLSVEIGGIKSNTVSFSVSGCSPPPSQPQLELDPPPGPNGFCLGAGWGLRVANAMADAEIRLVGIRDGATWEWPGWGKTDSGGNFNTGGTFGDGSQGKHLLYVDIGGIKSNVVSLSVSDCTGPTYQPHLEINPSSDDGFCPGPGHLWILQLTNAPPNTAVSLVGGASGVPPGFQLSEGAQTDSLGNLSASGPVILPAGGTEHSYFYVLTVEVGALRSNMVIVITGPCE
jgi:hypothetical protein